MSFAGLLLLAVLAVVVWVIFTYNRLITLRTRLEEALSGIDVQLKRRADLIPDLVESVKGYVKHEKGVFENVSKARSALMSAQTPKEKAVADSQLGAALKSLFAVAEAYPELKANENFMDLQRQLEDTEDKVAYSRQFYNTNVREYNTKLQVFPSNMIANNFGFKPYEFFEAEAEEREDVKVKF
jgi:LemA protein